MTTVKPVRTDTNTGVGDPVDATGWLHDCGAFTYSPIQPNRCGVCWSALRTGQAHNGSWQPANIGKEIRR